MQTFGFSPSARFGAGLLSASLGSAISIILLSNWLASPTQQVNIALLSLSALLSVPLVWSIRFYLRTRDQVSVSEQGLTYLCHNESPRTASWEEIAKLKPCPLRNRYDVVNRLGNRLLTISYELDGIEHLVEIIRRRLQRSSQDPHLLYQANRSAGTIVLWLCVINALSFLYLDHTPRLIYSLILTLVLIPWTLFFELRSIRIDSRGVIFEYLCRRLKIPYLKMTGVVIEGEWIASLRHITIRIERSGTKPFRFGWSGNEGRILCKAIEEYWANSQQRK